MEQSTEGGGEEFPGRPENALRPLLNAAATRRIDDWIAVHFPRARPDRYSFVIMTGDDPPTAVPARDRSIYGIGCLQDVMLAALTVMMHDRQLLSLDDRLSDHLPDLLTGKGDAVRLHHLLSRSSGCLMPNPGTLRAPLSGWEDFCSFVGRLSPRFPPGSIAAHSLLERIILLRILQNILGQDPYEVMRSEFWPAGSSVEFGPSGGVFGSCYRKVLCSLDDLAECFASQACRRLFGRLNTAPSAQYADRAHCIKDWAPKSAALGFYRMENGFWGQDGDDPLSGSLAIRLDPGSRTIILGRFATSAERDFLLGLVSADLFGLAIPERDFRLGTIAGFTPAELSGSYDGMLGNAISIVVHEGRLHVVGLVPGDGALPLDVRSDGTMHSRWAGQTLWIEPLRLPDSGQIALHFGRHLYLKSEEPG